jgi:hypothetical protein
MCVEKDILRGALLRNFFDPLPISSLLVSNILFSALFSKPPNQNLFMSVLIILQISQQRRRHVVAQLVEALRYKSEGRGFDGVIEIFH